MVRKFKTIPEKIRIGSHIFYIKFVNRVDESEDLLGRIQWSDNTIRIDNSLDQTRAECILLHEILHGVKFLTGFSDNVKNIPDNEVEELIISRIDGVLYQILKDNKLAFVEDSK